MGDKVDRRIRKTKAQLRAGLTKLMREKSVKEITVKELVDEGKLTDKERSVIITYQTSGSAFVTNYFSSGAAAFSILLAPIIVPLLVIFVYIE